MTIRPIRSLDPLIRIGLLAAMVSLFSGCAAYRACGLSGCPGDAALTSEVRGLFDQQAALQPPTLIHVQTIDHVVYLYGLVNTDLQRQLAESVARAAPGSTRVVNSIEVDSVGG